MNAGNVSIIVSFTCFCALYMLSNSFVISSFVGATPSFSNLRSISIVFASILVNDIFSSLYL